LTSYKTYILWSLQVVALQYNISLFSSFSDLLWTFLCCCQSLQTSPYLHWQRYCQVQGKEEDRNASSSFLCSWQCLPIHVARSWEPVLLDHVSGVSILPLSTILGLNFGNVPTVWYFLFSPILFHVKKIFWLGSHCLYLLMTRRSLSWSFNKKWRD
jgi:hypothetical protein